MPKSQIALRVAQMKKQAIRKKLTLADISAMSGIPYPTLQKFHKADWNPTLQTIVKLEKSLF